MRSFHEKTWVDHLLWVVPIIALILFLAFTRA